MTKEKRAAEALCFDYARVHGVAVRVVRIFNTYGPRMLPDDGRVISNFLVQALSGRKLTIYGDGSQSRSFCYVDDLVEGILRLMALKDNPGPVNIGNPAEFSIAELAEKIVEMMPNKVETVFKSLPEDDPRQRRPDLRRAETLLNWKPRVSLTQGLEATLQYFQALLKKYQL